MQLVDAAYNEHAAAAYVEMIRNLDAYAEYFISADETGVDNTTSLRRYGRALRGVRPSVVRHTVKGEHLTVIAAMSVRDGMMTEHALIMSGYLTKEVFEEWFDEVMIRRGVLQPFPGPNSILLIDNMSGHDFPSLQAKAAAVGGLVLPNAPKCTDFQPVEGGFHSMKNDMRNQGQVAYMANPAAVISAALHAVTPAKAAGLFRGCKFRGERVYPFMGEVVGGGVAGGEDGGAFEQHLMDAIEIIAEEELA